MPDKSWKAFERRIAKLFPSGKRIPVTGERAGADVVTPDFAIQVKKGRKQPAYLSEWLEGITRSQAAIEGRVPLVVWQKWGERDSESVAVLRLSDLLLIANMVHEGMIKWARTTERKVENAEQD